MMIILKIGDDYTEDDKEDDSSDDKPHSTTTLPCGHEGCNCYKGCLTCVGTENSKKRKASEAADAKHVKKLLKSLNWLRRNFLQI